MYGVVGSQGREKLNGDGNFSSYLGTDPRCVSQDHFSPGIGKYCIYENVFVDILVVQFEILDDYINFGINNNL